MREREREKKTSFSIPIQPLISSLSHLHTHSPLFAEERLNISRKQRGRPKSEAHKAATSAALKASWAFRKREAAAAAARTVLASRLGVAGEGGGRPLQTPVALPAAAAAALAAKLPALAIPSLTAAPFEPRRGAAADEEAAAVEVEAALAELAVLRARVGAWVAEFSAEHGRSPSREDARVASPAVYEDFTRLVALRDFVRSADARG